MLTVDVFTVYLVGALLESIDDAAVVFLMAYLKHVRCQIR